MIWGVILSGGSTLSGRSRRIPITTLNLGIGVLRIRASPEARSSTQDEAQEFRLDTMTHPHSCPCWSEAPTPPGLAGPSSEACSLYFRARERIQLRIRLHRETDKRLEACAAKCTFQPIPPQMSVLRSVFDVHGTHVVLSTNRDPDSIVAGLNPAAKKPPVPTDGVQASLIGSRDVGYPIAVCR